MNTNSVKERGTEIRVFIESIFSVELSSSGPGCDPFKVVTRVRISVALPIFSGCVAEAAYAAVLKTVSPSRESVGSNPTYPTSLLRGRLVA